MCASFTIQSQSVKLIVVRADLFNVTSLTTRTRIPICNLNAPLKRFIPTAAIGRMIAFNNHNECRTQKHKCVVFSSPEYELPEWDP